MDPVTHRGLAPGGSIRVIRGAALVLFLLGVGLITGGSILTTHSQDKTAEVLGIVLQNLGIVVAAVPLIEFLWAMGGGPPLQHDLNSRTQQLMQSQQQATASLSSVFEEMTERLRELTDSGINQVRTDLRMTTEAITDLNRAGITGIRSARQDDQTARTLDWQNRLRGSREVDLFGLTLWRQWFEHEELHDGLRNAILQGCRARIVLLAQPEHSSAPDPPSLGQRLSQPAERNAEDMLRAYLRQTHQKLVELRAEIQRDRRTGGDRDALGSLDIYHVRACTFYSQVVRIDDSMYVSFYRASKLGDYSLAIEVQGRESELFRQYIKEINDVIAHEEEGSHD